MLHWIVYYSTHGFIIYYKPTKLQCTNHKLHSIFLSFRHTASHNGVSSYYGDHELYLAFSVMHNYIFV